MSPEAADAALWKEYAETRSEGCRERIVKRYLPLIKYVVGRMVVTPPSGLDLGVQVFLHKNLQFQKESGSLKQSGSVGKPEQKELLGKENRQMEFLA